MSIHTHALGISHNAKLLRAKVSKHAVVGAAIAVSATIIATVLSSYFNEGGISLEGIMTAQRSNIMLWIMDGMAFIFPLWGQYVSSILSYEASAMVHDQTHELRNYTIALEKKATHDATHDSLTNLPNRMLFIDRLQQAINLAARENDKLAVCILDIDRFKDVNDTLGHYNGDRLIKQLALRLTGLIRESDTLARIGGDEFGFVLPKMAKKDDLKKIGKKLQKALEPPFVLEDLSIDVSASMGAAFYPQHGNDVDTLIQRADVAMYVAKQENSGITLYSKELDGHSPHRLTLGGELREAINNDRLTLCYQPKVLCHSNGKHAAEVLVRWQHPRHGLMLPDQFIPMAERTGLVYDLTLCVLKQSLRQCRVWYDAGVKVEISVNVSSLCLLDPEFPDILAGLLASYELPAKSLMIEITETSIMANPERSYQVLNRIADMGVGVSIDDFGTGYSSLAYLKKLPATELKIDKSFVKDMLENESDMTIVNATAQLAHNLGLTVAAEGVENSLVFHKLKELGCDALQGYFISKPVGAEEFFAWIGTKGKSFLYPEQKERPVGSTGEHSL